MPEATTPPSPRPPEAPGQAAASGGTEQILDLLISPASAPVFFEAHWETAPLLVTRDEPSRFAPLLTQPQVDAYLEGGDLRHPPVRLARLGGVETSTYLHSRRFGGMRVDGVVDGEALFRQHADGASIVIDRAHEVFPSLARAAAALQRYTGLSAQASVFLSPPVAQSFPVHYDPAGVFVLQIAGRKVWRVFDQPASWPLQEQYDPNESIPDHGIAVEVELTPGSTLYVPRGHYHQVVTTDSDSIHVSLGVTPLTWIEVLRRSIDELARDRDFREAPVEQVLAVRDPEALRRKWRHLMEKAKQVDPMAAWREPSDPVCYDQRGRVDDLRRIPDIGLHTAVRVRADREPSVEILPDGVRLRFADRGVRFPAELAAPLREVITRRSASAALLAEVLEDDDALNVVRLLVREGLLTLDTEN